MNEYISNFSIYTHKGIEIVHANSVINKNLIVHLQKQKADRRIYQIGKSSEFKKEINSVIENDIYAKILFEKKFREDLYSAIKLISIPYCKVEALEYFKDKDPYTYKHLLTVYCLSLYIISQFRIKNNSRNTYLGSLSHDIGKCSIPLEIIQKETPLTLHERKQIEHHAIAGYVLLNYFSDSYNYTNAINAIIARDHHENKNGNGYPIGRKSLNLYTEIVIVCDIYDALLSPRSYRKEAFDNRTALEVLTQKALEGTISQDVVKVLIAGNRKIKTPWPECIISKESRGQYPKDNNYGKFEEQ